MAFFHRQFGIPAALWEYLPGRNPRAPPYEKLFRQIGVFISKFAFRELFVN